MWLHSWLLHHLLTLLQPLQMKQVLVLMYLLLAQHLTTYTTAFTSTAAGNALTLADGAQGQIKNIVYVAEAAGGDTGVLTPTNLGAGTTITFNAVGDSCQLQFIGTDWWAISLRGAVLA